MMQHEAETRCAMQILPVPTATAERQAPSQAPAGGRSSLAFAAVFGSQLEDAMRLAQTDVAASGELLPELEDVDAGEVTEADQVAEDEDGEPSEAGSVPDSNLNPELRSQDVLDPAVGIPGAEVEDDLEVTPMRQIRRNDLVQDSGPTPKVARADGATPGAPSTHGQIQPPVESPAPAPRDRVARATSMPAALSSQALSTGDQDGPLAQGAKIADMRSAPTEQVRDAHRPGTPSVPAQSSDAAPRRDPERELETKGSKQAGSLISADPGAMKRMSPPPQPVAWQAAMSRTHPAGDASEARRVPDSLLEGPVGPGPSGPKLAPEAVPPLRPSPVPAVGHGRHGLDVANALRTPGVEEAIKPEQLRLDLATTPASGPDAASQQIRADASRLPAPQIVQIMTRQPDRPVEIRLEPEELGRVHMSLSTRDSSVTVVISADRAETIDLMRRHIDQLAQEFRRQGFDSVGFEFRDRGNNQSGHAHARSESATGQHAQTDPDLSEAGPEVGRPGPRPDGGIDMRL